MLIAQVVVVSDARHAASTTEFGVVATKEVVLAIEFPPRQVHVHAADAIMIVRRHLLERGEISATIAADRVHQIAAHDAGGIGQPVGKECGPGIQQQPRRFAGAGCDNESPGVNALFLASGSINIGDRLDLAVLADDKFPRHRTGDQRETSGLLGRGNHHLARTEVGRGNASAATLRAVVAGGTPVVGLGQDRQPRRNAKNIQVVAGLLDNRFGAAGLGRRQENSVGSAGNIFFRTEDSDIGFDLVVVGSNVVVTQGPVVAHAVMRADSEIHRSHAEGDASPVIGASADDAGTEPAELRTGSGNVRFPFNFPSAVGGEEFVFEALPCPSTDTGAAMRQFVRPDVLLVVALGNQRRAGLEQRDTQTALGEDLGRGASRGAGTDDANVIGFGRALNLHGIPVEVQP